MWRVCLVAFVASCYRPNVVAGSPCGATGACPSPLVCAATGTCETTDIDAPLADARARDARPIDARADAGLKAKDAAGIAWKAITSQTIPASAPATSVAIPEPVGVALDDVMIAVVAMGQTGEALQPVFTPPSGWTLVSQVFEADDSGLAVFSHVAGLAETGTYTFTFNEAIEGVAWISVYSGVAKATPVDVYDGVLDSGSGVDYTAPTVTTTAADDVLVVAFASHDAATATTWTAPSAVNVRIDINDGTTRSGLGFDVAMPAPGPTAAFEAIASTTQDYALVQVTALRP